MSKTIELIKSEIYEAESNLLKFNQLSIENPKREGYSFWVTYFTNRLNILEQIKCELEAWEVVKDNVDVYGHEYNGELVEYVQITEEQLPDEKHINIIKKAKALEVK